MMAVDGLSATFRCLGQVGLICAAAALTSGPSSAGDRSSVYTSIRNADCRFERRDGPGSEEAQTKRCPGLAGAGVVVDAGGTSVALGFAWPAARPRAEVRAVVTGWSLGERVEWRGSGGGSQFAPDTATVRVLFNREGTGQVGHQVLAVLHVRPGTACLRGLVDMTASAQPYDLARRISDDPGPFACGYAGPRVEGHATDRTDLLMMRSKLVR